MDQPGLRKVFFVIIICMLAGFVLSTGCVTTGQKGGKTDGLDEFVTRTMADYHVPGAVVGIVENDTIVYLKGFGVRDAGKTGTVDPDTRFQIASVSKYITGAAVGTLVDEQKLDWDTPVVRYLPQFRMNDTYAGEHVTLRDLLAHRSGLKKFDGELLGRVGYTNDEILTRVQYLKPGAGFREKYLYSNIGYFVAGEVAAHADNRSWEDLTDARIIRPLGMTRSGAHPGTLYLDENHISGHAGTGTEIHTIPLELASLPAAGQVVSTGRDMTQFIRMMLANGTLDGKLVLRAGTVKEIHAASLVAGASGPLNDPNGATGLGADSYQFLGERVIEKNGALDGVRSVVVLVPGRNSGLVVIANKQLTAFPEAVRDEFLERYIGMSGLDLQAREKASQAGWDSLIKSPARPENAVPARIGSSAVAGNYTSDLYGALQIRPGPDPGNMTIRLGPSGYEGNLTHWTLDTWYLSWPNPDDLVGFLTIGADSSGQVTGFDSKEFGPFVRVSG